MTIQSLHDLAEVINAADDYPADIVEHACAVHGWRVLDNECDICEDRAWGWRLSFDWQGVAKVYDI